MSLWEITMLKATNAFSTQDYVEAKRLNKCALKIARQGLEEEFKVDPEAALASVMVCLFNLSDIAIYQQQPQQACEYLLQTVTDIQNLPTPISQLQQHAILRSVQQIRMEWQRFNQHYPHHFMALDNSQQLQHHLWQIDNQLHALRAH
ncbi:hypothetical protein [Motilimonas pumila]|uniref:Uncharacterized protein n=1 Tax=Motilimonas pumila TaxID=2303987 RepID=A0A418YAH4_9GAMM|nr:hypothetical protein [Motilimonas pumila]RJG39542.1 hypothetical protein D1Z90_18055 [Motilimonas pumila]